jgi:hypothetical protein
MKITTAILVAMIALVIGGGTGYFTGKNANDTGARTKELQDSITMMNEQALTIQKISELMQAHGVAMQEFGARYKDDQAISKGKDLEMLGEKYMTEAMNASEAHSSMTQMPM